MHGMDLTANYLRLAQTVLRVAVEQEGTGWIVSDDGCMWCDFLSVSPTAMKKAYDRYLANG